LLAIDLKTNELLKYSSFMLPHTHSLKYSYSKIKQAWACFLFALINIFTISHRSLDSPKSFKESLINGQAFLLLTRIDDIFEALGKNQN
jgi:hypothetical protein